MILRKRCVILGEGQRLIDFRGAYEVLGGQHYYPKSTIQRADS